MKGKVYAVVWDNFTHSFHTAWQEVSDIHNCNLGQNFSNLKGLALHGSEEGAYLEVSSLNAALSHSDITVLRCNRCNMFYIVTKEDAKGVQNNSICLCSDCIVKERKKPWKHNVNNITIVDEELYITRGDAYFRIKEINSDDSAKLLKVGETKICLLQDFVQETEYEVIYNTFLFELAVKQHNKVIKKLAKKYPAILNDLHFVEVDKED